MLREALSVLTDLAGVLGIDLEASETSDGSGSSESLKGVVEFLLELREEARQSKDFAKSDQIRDRLAQLGITIADTKDGPTWKMS